MTISITKGCFDRFWDEAIGENWCIDEWDVNDERFLSAGAHEAFRIGTCFLQWQGEGDPKPSEWITQADIDGGVDGLRILKRWQQGQASTVVAFELPNEALGDVVAYAKERGARVLGESGRPD